MIVAVSMLLLGDKRMHQLYMRDQKVRSSRSQ
jgi:hypothetical protein